MCWVKLVLSPWWSFGTNESNVRRRVDRPTSLAFRDFRVSCVLLPGHPVLLEVLLGRLFSIS